MIYVTFQGCAGWLHPGGGARGVVVVPAHGFEDLCTRHAMRVLADRLAAAGVPTLRMDLHGTGDSAGSDGDPDRVATWIGDVEGAAAWLRAETGVTEIVLVGLRLGALLALAASDRISVSRLVLVAPPQSGPAYVRENAILAQVLDTPREDGDTDGITVAGFRLSAETVAGLKELEPSLAHLSGTDILVLGPDNGRSASRLLARLRDVGASVSEDVFRGYGHMMADPTASVLPDAALDGIAAWIGLGDSGGSPARRHTDVGHLRGAGWVEQGIAFAGDRAPAGILCEPAAMPGRRKTVIFLNAGGIYHIGWARMYVDIARRLAASGVASLRLDLPGIGDGAPWTGPGRATFYDPAGESIRAAIDLVGARGATDIVLAGGCSGAHHSFHTASADPRVGGLVLVNLLCFVWGPSYAIPLDAWRASKPREIANRRRLAEDEGERGGNAMRRVIGAALPPVKVAARKIIELWQTFGGPASRWLRARTGAVNEVESAFYDLSRRGTRLRLIYSEDDPGRTELERYMGAGGRRATGLAGVDVHLIAGADHALTTTRARADFEALLRDFLRLTEQSREPGVTRSSDRELLPA